MLPAVCRVGSDHATSYDIAITNHSSRRFRNLVTEPSPSHTRKFYTTVDSEPMCTRRPVTRIHESIRLIQSITTPDILSIVDIETDTISAPRDQQSTRKSANLHRESLHDPPLSTEIQYQACSGIRTWFGSLVFSQDFIQK